MKSSGKKDPVLVEIRNLTSEIESLQQEIQQAEITGTNPETLLARHQKLTKERYKLYQIQRSNSELPAGFRHIEEVLQEIQGTFLLGVI